jgi:outer membrane immunogenic protein
MQRIALVAATALVAAFAQGAHAADMSVTPFFRGSPVVIGYNWQGYYVGANVGWSRASSDISWTPDPTVFLDAGPITSAANNTLSSNGATGGIQTGYNWQWGNIVAGIEGDIDFVRNNANLSTAPIPGALPFTALSESARLDWLITVRPRIGYAWDNWLLYVTGGWALGKAVWSDALTAGNGQIIGTTMSRELGGWTVGAGVEYGLVSGWSLKAEYLYTDLGSAAVLMGPTGLGLVVAGGTVGTNHTMTDQIARIGFNFRFGGEHEVVVKYPN